MIFCLMKSYDQEVAVKAGEVGRILTAVLAMMLVASALFFVAPLSRAPLAGADGPASPTSVTCSDSSTFGTTTESVQLGVVVTGAPAQSLPGKTFTVAISDPGETLPTMAQGLPITSETDVQVTYPVPAGATFDGATLSGGAGVGDGPSI
jgi:hypothetical protein